MRNLLILSFLFSFTLSFGQEIDLRTNTAATKVKKPLIILNYQGDQLTMKNRSLDGIEPEWIEKINVLKGTSATSLYGEKEGKDGVIILTFKTSEEIKAFFESEKERLSLVKESGDLPTVYTRTVEYKKTEDGNTTINIRNESDSADKPLIVVQYKEDEIKLSEKGSLGDITLERVKTFKVLKDQASLEKYEATDKKGIIIMVLDKTKKSSRLFKKLEKRKQVKQLPHRIKSFF